jgi:hypothetical protein
VGPSGQRERERERARAQLGRLERAAGRGEERGRRAERREEGKGNWAAGKGIGPRGREGISFPFSFSGSFETQIYLNSNEFLNSNPLHSLK